MVTWFAITAFAGSASVQLPSAPGLHDRWDAGRAWGTPLLIDTLTDVLEQLAWDHPSWDPITVGDISRRGGGHMFGHKTHDRGIDADLGLFTQGGRTRASFEDLHPRHIDPAATWTLIEALFETENTQFILLDQQHINRVAHWLEHERGWARAEVRAILLPAGARVPWSTRGVVRHAPNHRSHMHVRITSPPPPRPTN